MWTRKSAIPMCCKERIFFPLNREKGEISIKYCNHQLYRTNHITQIAQNTLGCGFHLKGHIPWALQKKMLMISERRSTKPTSQRFPQITGQRTKRADQWARIKKQKTTTLEGGNDLERLQTLKLPGTLLLKY